MTGFIESVQADPTGFLIVLAMGVVVGYLIKRHFASK